MHNFYIVENFVLFINQNHVLCVMILRIMSIKLIKIIFIKRKEKYILSVLLAVNVSQIKTGLGLCIIQSFYGICMKFHIF